MSAFNPEHADSAIENTPISSSSGIPPVDPVQKVGDAPHIPQRVKRLEDEVGELKSRMKQVRTDLGEMKRNTAEILKRLPPTNNLHSE
jgi:uncharacterized protein (DUF342 family)